MTGKASMSEMDQSRRFDRVPVTSAYPPIAATERTSRHVSKVPTADSNRGLA